MRLSIIKLKRFSKISLQAIASQVLKLPTLDCWLIFVICVGVYLANGQAIASYDSFPNALLAFNWLDQKTFHFDAFRTYWGVRPVPYAFAESPNGHLTSTYPIGTAIVTFPIYFTYFVGIRLLEWWQSRDLGHSVDLLNITDPNSFQLVHQYEKVAATLITAFAVVLFYLIMRLKFQRAIALITTFIYAFSTSVWSINSQALWQHGSANLVLLAITLGLLKANRTQGNQQKALLLAIGFLCGLLPGIRPVHLLFAIAATVYVVFTYRKNALYFLIGLPSTLISASWNFYYFGFSLKNFLIAGYAHLNEAGKSFTGTYYQWNIQQFLEGFGGLLISPSRGLLIYSPAAILAVPGTYALVRRPGKDEQWFLCLTLASLLLFLQYCFFTVWTGASCYGTRYLTDTMPVLCLLIGYGLGFGLEKVRRQRFGLICLSVLIIYSTSVQAVGVFGSNFWFGIPYAASERFWQWQDTEIERHVRRVYFDWLKPIRYPGEYRKSMSGKMVSLSLLGEQPLQTLTVKSAALVTLEAQLQNTGRAPWYGYETGMKRGMAIVMVKFLDQQQHEIQINTQTNRLYVSGLDALGVAKSGSQVTASGAVMFPQEPGAYEMVFGLAASSIKPNLGSLPLNYSIEVQVEPSAVSPLGSSNEITSRSAP